MAMLKRTISIGRTGGGLSYRSLSSGKSESLNHVDTLGMVKGVEAINVPSTQAEALTGAITGGLESVMEKVKADIAKSEEYQSTRVAEEVRKLRADIDKMRADIATMQAERRCDHDIHLHIEQDIIKGSSDLRRDIIKGSSDLRRDIIKASSDMRRDFNQLKAEFEATEYRVLKYAIYTLASVSAAGFSMLYSMI